MIKSRFKYVVVMVDMPEYEQGSVTNLISFDNPLEAIEYKENLEIADLDIWYDVIIERV